MLLWLPVRPWPGTLTGRKRGPMDAWTLDRIHDHIVAGRRPFTAEVRIIEEAATRLVALSAGTYALSVA